jgi:CRISPR/Cas system-associated exonuclease Cas4 (RecB family)
MNLETKVKPLALERGVIIHSLLESYYKGEDWMPKLKAYAKQFNSLMEEEREYYGANFPEDLKSIMERYVKTYKGKKEKILAIELSFVDNPVEILPGLKLRGIIDLIIKDERGTWIVEHKTHKRIPGEEQRFYDMQTALYTIVAEKLGYKIDGILWNYLRTKPPTIPKALVKGGISRAKDIDTDYDTYYKAIIEAGCKPEDYQEELNRVKFNKFFERRYMPKSERLNQSILKEVQYIAKRISKIAKYPYRALDKMICQGCSYKSLCQSELLGLDTEFILKNEYKVRAKEVKNVDKEQIEED